MGDYDTWKTTEPDDRYAEPEPVEYGDVGENPITCWACGVPMAYERHQPTCPEGRKRRGMVAIQSKLDCPF
jgi:hypothetical protein